ncbi:hypothetical protein C5468_01880 [Photorhabdus luminescens subsp. mexicana]|uniref:Uncharacterized protein n=1 Tax=Photorhabdus luminescens subsp. mexicana TaxID=2100167 RepID=A0A4R4JNP5_PHOLU|nr:hypothetical protein C5468_01880 [Photorhabdus luminescens subsp. mexicana]
MVSIIAQYSVVRSNRQPSILIESCLFLNYENALVIFLLTRALIIPVIFQVASLLAALTHPSHIVIYAPGDSFPCRRDAS